MELEVQRNLRVDTVLHNLFLDYSSREVGQKLAEAFLEEMQNTSTSKASASSHPAEPLYLPFKLPIIKGAVLPGGMYYLYIRSPALIPDQSSDSEGSELITDTDGTYFSIHIDAHEIVDSITYFGKTYVEVENFVFLIGLSHYYLYHILDRVFGGTTPSGPSWSSNKSNLLSFLRETFTPALYHDRFSELRLYLEECMHNEVESQLESHGINVDEKVPVILPSMHKALGNESKKFVQRKLLDYLRENRHHLYMYHIP